MNDALVNLFCERLNSECENANKLANKMFVYRNRSNETRDIVESHGLHRKSQFEDVEEKKFANFQKMSLKTMKSEMIRIKSWILIRQKSLQLEFNRVIRVQKAIEYLSRIHHN